MSILKITLISIAGLIGVSTTGGYFYFKGKFKVAPSELKLPDSTVTIPFRWIEDSLGDEVNPHAAMLLPISVPGCPKTFHVQFDLGAPTSVFYANKFEAINNKYSTISIQQEEGKFFLKHFQFQVGGSNVTAGKISLKKYSNDGINWTDSTKIEIIGTLGSDLIEDKVLVIDYPTQQISISPILHDSIKSKVRLTHFKWKERRILLPAIIGNKETSLYFDTGSSAFELLTSKSIFDELRRPGAEIKRYGVNSWGNTLWAFTSPTDCLTVMGGNSIPLKKVTYIEGTSFIQNLLMRFSGMGGMTGNKLFVDKVLIIDTHQEVFGMYK